MKERHKGICDDPRIDPFVSRHPDSVAAKCQDRSIREHLARLVVMAAKMSTRLCISTFQQACHAATPSVNPAPWTDTFRQFRSGSRANSPGMSDLLRTLDEGDIDAVAAYLNAAQ